MTNSAQHPEILCSANSSKLIRQIRCSNKPNYRCRWSRTTSHTHYHRGSRVTLSSNRSSNNSRSIRIIMASTYRVQLNTSIPSNRNNSINLSCKLKQLGWPITNISSKPCHSNKCNNIPSSSKYSHLNRQPDIRGQL